jgi:uncharacterized protein with von Willebrand factor type A (vWA) domain
VISGLEHFVAELRGAGLAASPAEWIDALRAVALLGLEDRERFRLALRCALAKRVHQQRVFDAVFERFFAPPARGPSRRRRSGLGGGEAGRRRSRVTEAGPRREARQDRPRAPAPPSPLAPARNWLDPRELRRLLERVREGGPERPSRLRHVVVEARSSASSRGSSDLNPPVSPRHPSRRDLHRRLSVDDEREIAALVPRLIERIRLRSGRRLFRARRGRLYLRSVFRENLSQDGVPFVLPRRRLRPRRSRVVLLIDVSWSAASAAGLFLSLALEFLKGARETRVLLFVDRAVEATQEVEDWMRRSVGQPRTRRTRRKVPGAGIVRGDVSFARLLRSVRGLNLDAPSDYGRAFDSLLRSPLRPAGRDTLLLVLGDGRTNRFDPQDWAFEEITASCGATIWLVPETLQEWGTGDSALGAYLPHVDTAVEARDLLGLARGVTELVRRL